MFFILAHLSSIFQVFHLLRNTTVHNTNFLNLNVGFFAFTVAHLECQSLLPTWKPSKGF